MMSVVWTYFLSLLVVVAVIGVSSFVTYCILNFVDSNVSGFAGPKWAVHIGRAIVFGVCIFFALGIIHWVAQSIMSGGG